MTTPLPKPPRGRRESRTLRDHRRRGASVRRLIVGRLGLHGRAVTAIVAADGQVIQLVYEAERTVH